jgi:hypothetical protein
VVTILGLIWAAAPLAAFFVQRRFALDEFLAPIPVNVLSLVAVAVIAWRTPRGRWTPLNQKMAHLLAFALCAQTVGLVYARLTLPDSGASVAAVMLAFWCVIIGAIASTLASEVWPSSVIFALGAAAALAWQEWRYLIGAATNAALIINVTAISLGQRRQLAARAGPNAAPPS